MTEAPGKDVAPQNDYSNADLKSSVLSCRLKLFLIKIKDSFLSTVGDPTGTDSGKAIARRFSGRTFHTLGAKFWNARPARLVLFLGTASLKVPVDLSSLIGS